MKKEEKKTYRICCPYGDNDSKSCGHPKCIRMSGLECWLKNNSTKTQKPLKSTKIVKKGGKKKHGKV